MKTSELNSIAILLVAYVLRRFYVDQGVEQVVPFAGDYLRGILRQELFVGFFAEGRGEALIAPQGCDGIAQGFGIARRGENADGIVALYDDFGEAAVVRGYHGFGIGCRFENSHGEPFIPTAGHHKEPCIGIKVT